MRIWVTTQGPALTTVTGTIRLFSSKTWVMPSFSPRIPFNAVAMTSLLDVHVDRGRQIDAHERVHRLRCGIENVDEPLVRAHLEVLAAVLVLVRRADDAVDVLLRRQGNRSHHTGTRAGHRLDDLARARIDGLVVICLEPDADLLSRHGSCSPSLFSVVLVQERARGRHGRSRIAGRVLWERPARPPYY